MAKAYLLLGGNLGDRLRLLAEARAEIDQKIGLIESESAVYETEPWGFENDSLFLNQLVIAETDLTPENVLREALDIENKLGRIRNSKDMVSRTSDIDILFIDQIIMARENLTIPHPRLHLRRFALEPLNEIVPDFVHPLLGKTMSTLLMECKDGQKVDVLAEH